MARILALDTGGTGTVPSLYTVHNLDASTDTYATWALLLAGISLSDVETFNDYRNMHTGSEGHSTFAFVGGTAPTTARPAQGSTKRAAGQGCLNCVFRNGCVSTIGKRTSKELSNDSGTACTSYSAT